MPATLKVGICQSHTRPDTASTIEVLRSQTHQATAQGISILVFPEAFLGGYPRTCTFGSSIGARDPAGRDQFLEYHRTAVDLGDTYAGGGDDWVMRRLPLPSTYANGQDNKCRGDGTREVLEEISRETDVFLVVGLVEKVTGSGSLFCSAVYIHPQHGMIGKRRKTQPTGTERLVWAQGSPSTLKAVATTIKGVRVVMGSAICWENYMPLLRYSLYAQGVNLWLAPTADARDGWQSLVKTIAAEGRCFVLSANQCTKWSDLPAWATGLETQKESKSESPSQATSRSQVETDKDTHRPGTSSPLSTNMSSTAGRTNSTPNPNPIRRSSLTTRTSDGTHEIAWVPAAYNDANTTSAPAPPTSTSTSTWPTSRSKATPQHQPTDPTPSPSSSYASRGGSCIVSPLGTILSGPSWETQDELISTEVDFEDCSRGKLDFDVCGHYGRGDVFKLSVEGLDLNPPA